MSECVLIHHPAVGSVWLSNVRYDDDTVVGDAWDNSMVGSPYYPDDYRGEACTMNFPVSCIVKRIQEEIDHENEDR